MKLIIILIFIGLVGSRGSPPSRTNWDLQAPYSWAAARYQAASENSHVR